MCLFMRARISFAISVWTRWQVPKGFMLVSNLTILPKSPCRSGNVALIEIAS